MNEQKYRDDLVYNIKKIIKDNVNFKMVLTDDGPKMILNSGCIDLIEIRLNEYLKKNSVHYKVIKRGPDSNDNYYIHIKFQPMYLVERIDLDFKIE